VAIALRAAGAAVQHGSEVLPIPSLPVGPQLPVAGQGTAGCLFAAGRASSLACAAGW
jgi:hypothetical protein